MTFFFGRVVLPLTALAALPVTPGPSPRRRGRPRGGAVRGGDTQAQPPPTHTLHSASPAEEEVPAPAIGAAGCTPEAGRPAPAGRGGGCLEGPRGDLGPAALAPPRGPGSCQCARAARGARTWFWRRRPPGSWFRPDVVSQDQVLGAKARTVP